MLVDRLIERAARFPALADILRPVVPVLRTCPRVDVTNISDFFWETKADDFDSAKDCPNCAPPWGHFWLEARAPKEPVIQRPNIALRAGSEYRERALGAFVEAWDIDDGNRAEGMLSDTRWLLRFSFFIEGANGSVAVPGLLIAEIRADGSVNRHMKGKTTIAEQAYSAAHLAAMRNLVRPLLLSLSFMHCKNVSMAEVLPPRQSKKALKRHREIPLLRYHVLEIGGMTRRLRREGRLDEVGLKRALHICRGHFAEYGAVFGKKALFGKFEGRFWVPMHVRGDANEGVVEKDYRLAPPAEPAK